jgi:hypothetical protein
MFLGTALSVFVVLHYSFLPLAETQLLAETELSPKNNVFPM